MYDHRPPRFLWYIPLPQMFRPQHLYETKPWTSRKLPGSLYVFGGEAVSLIPGAGFIPNSLNNLDGMLRDPWH